MENSANTVPVNFISSKDADVERVMHSRSDSIKFIFCNDANEVFDELYESLPSRYQENSKTLMTERDFVFESVQLMY